MSEETDDTITLDEVVTSAKQALDIRTTDSDIWLMDMCSEAVEQIDAPSIFRKQICALNIDLDNHEAKLPCGMKSLLGMRFGSGQACENVLYVDLPFLKECGCTISDSIADWRGVMEIQGRHIFFHFLPENTTSVTIGYMGLNVDSHGRAIIYYYYRRALRAYICWKYCLRNSDEVLYRSQKEDYRLEWVAQKKWIKSGDVKKEFHNQKHQIRSIMNSWIADKRNWQTI